jgi:hypothetical protein
VVAIPYAPYFIIVAAFTCLIMSFAFRPDDLDPVKESDTRDVTPE